MLETPIFEFDPRPERRSRSAPQASLPDSERCPRKLEDRGRIRARKPIAPLQRPDESCTMLGAGSMCRQSACCYPPMAWSLLLGLGLPETSLVQSEPLELVRVASSSKQPREIYTCNPRDRFKYAGESLILSLMPQASSSKASSNLARTSVRVFDLLRMIRTSLTGVFGCIHCCAGGRSYLMPGNSTSDPGPVSSVRSRGLEPPAGETHVCSVLQYRAQA